MSQPMSQLSRVGAELVEGETLVRLDMTGVQARILAKMLACAIKINECVSFETYSDRVTFRAVNTGRTAHYHATLGANWFAGFYSKATDDEPLPDLQIACKRLVAAFKPQPNHGAPGIQRVQLALRRGDDFVQVLVETTVRGITKEYRLNYREEASHKTDDIRGPDCNWRCRARLIHEALSHFPPSLETLQFLAAADRFNVSSPDPNGDNSVVLSLNTGAFLAYNLSDELKLQSPLRPKVFEARLLRFFCALCDGCGFELVCSAAMTPESPMLFEARGADGAQVESMQTALLVAAWEPEESQMPASRRSTQQGVQRSDTPVSIQTNFTDYRRSPVPPSQGFAPFDTDPRAMRSGSSGDAVMRSSSNGDGAVLADPSPYPASAAGVNSAVKRMRVAPSQNSFVSTDSWGQQQQAHSSDQQIFPQAVPPPAALPQSFVPVPRHATFSMTPPASAGSNWRVEPYTNPDDEGSPPRSHAEGSTPGDPLTGQSVTGGRRWLEEELLEPSPSPERLPF
eukprot:Hpha_TRINITY_DN4647_c0_g1::TRINITY_DN4647_c0_g1_i1::g.97030::m.97030/K10994/RAD9A; cell cycle checkpoint control protein RAD9A